MLKAFLEAELRLALFWLVLGLFAGLVFSLELLGVEGSMTLLNMERARSLHISLMLYGFVPLMLSLLPFSLFEQDGVLSSRALKHLKRYFAVWNIFLLFMTFALLFGNLRGLPFYDFPYQLNFLLAFSGVFYLLALIDALRAYEYRPLWVNVSLAVVVIAPILLIVLMNPQYGQVEHTLIGPHGDNTLGMSFALIPLYYLLIKLSARQAFVPRGHILWMIPLGGYLLSLIIRNFFHTLSYNEEWFFQYLTFLYVPLLWIWWRDAKLSFKSDSYLFLSIVAFLFVDIEGNLLFFPQIRELIHRNDLVIGHAHVAMGIGIAFMALAIMQRILPSLFTKAYAIGWTLLVSLMAGTLTVAGLIEAGWIEGDVQLLWGLRSLFGLMLILMIGHMALKDLSICERTLMGWYHLIGFLSDFGGGMLLILSGALLFPALGFGFSGTYEYVVFAFMMGTGLVHWFGLSGDAMNMAGVSAAIRLMVSATFGALYMAEILDEIALIVALYDAAYAMIYILWLKERA
ncbi:MAG: hypothetical protein Q8N01_02255 [Sulfuricurvum sp.]|nr:hypothetical protein [Sulfuricurvum sp.]